jgi:hypothetical protein
MNVLALATGLTLVALDLSGVARNEVGRVWMFFTPFVLLIAAATLAQFDRRLRAMAFAAQIVWLLAIATTWWPWHAELFPVTTYEQVALAPLPTPLTPAGALFDGHVRLQGFQSRYVPETRTLVVALHWRALQVAEAPQHFSGGSGGAGRPHPAGAALGTPGRPVSDDLLAAGPGARRRDRRPSGVPTG